MARLNERSWPRVSRVFRALDLQFSIRTAGADLADYLESILAPLAAASTGGKPQHVFSVVDDGERFKSRSAVYFDGQPVIRTPSEPQALVYLLWQLNRSVVAASDRYLLVHAAAATNGGAAGLLPASMNSGKTTLVAGLVQRGLGYLTDEAAAIDPQTLMVDPFPSRCRSSSGRGRPSKHCVPSSSNGSRGSRKTSGTSFPTRSGPARSRCRASRDWSSPPASSPRRRPRSNA